MRLDDRGPLSGLLECDVDEVGLVVIAKRSLTARIQLQTKHFRVGTRVNVSLRSYGVIQRKVIGASNARPAACPD